MKKSIIITLLAAMCLPSYGRTPKEYFEAENGWRLISEDCTFNDEEDEQAVDNSFKEVRKYVYDEVLPTITPNSLEYADALLRWESCIGYFAPRYGEDVRAASQQIKKIVLPIEGKSSRYLTALDFEYHSWGVWFYWADPKDKYAPDTLETTAALLNEMIECSHNVYRPTDSYYIDLINKLAEQTFDPTHYVIKWPEGEEPIHYSYPFYRANLLWNDLLKWDSISAEEYTSICSGELLPFWDPIDDMEDDADVISKRCYFCNDKGKMSVIIYYNAFLPEEYIRICQAHEQITKRIYGMNSEEYIDAAIYYLEALRTTCRSDEAGAEITKQNMIRAKVLCEDVLKYSPLQKGSSSYYQWMLNLYNCRLSLEGASKKLQKEIDKTAKAVEATKDTLLMEQFLDLRTDCALMMQNYDYAIRIQNEELRKMPALPNPNDPDNFYAAEKFYYEAQKQLRTHINVLHTYVLSGDYENAQSALAYIHTIIFDGEWDMPDDNLEIGRLMHDVCKFSWDNIYPYRMKLYKRYNQAIFEHYGYKDE